jgi:murein DD-endopeptidase MepM/ murein hydrolase activator NlpD
MVAQPVAAQSPPTTNPLQGLLNKLKGTTTTAPSSSPTPAPAPGGQKPGAPGSPTPPPAPPKGQADAGAGAIPASAQAQINSIKRTGGRSTAQLLAALQSLVDVGLSQQEAMAVGMGHFPVGGQAAYSDDFLAPRFTPTFHLHQGNDIIAASGTPVRAPFDGAVSFSSDPAGGNDVYVRTGDGTYYFGAHLASYAKNVSSGQAVKQGQIVGYVGSTGDASGPHLHFEIHPKGGGAVNPKPILDRWLDEALANIPNILATYQVGLPPPIVDAGVLRRFDEPLSGGADADALLAASGAKSTGVTRLSELRAVRAGADSPIPSGPTSLQAMADQWQAAQQTSTGLLDPMTPPVLSRVLSPDNN